MCFTEYSVILLYNGCKVQTILFLFNLASWLLATVKLTSPPPTLTSQHTDTEEHTCVSVIQDEFYRITMVHLESKFMSKLDEFTPQLLKLFHTKGGSMGLQLQAILLKTPSNPNIHMKREIVIRCSMKFLGESSEQLLREYDDADEDRILQDLALQTLKIYIKPNPSEAPDIGIVVEGVKVLTGLENLPRACSLLVGIAYVLNLAYPKELKNTFEVFQKLFLGLDDTKLSPKINSLKNRLLA
ncbi:uncharacterized protein LOC130917242 [Corythoichthys intestinalis]|uniref:uncharacterized protein LOC130917242 n=1 Tax=Corythoichthys intestinalis TaxID=161448 RepID=UPI0025A5A116|nr:uncharacterized protein LOC130917242 [Corythoichthys intestinalis]